MRTMTALAALLAVAALAAAGCGGDGNDAAGTGTEEQATGETLTVYSGREEEIVAPLFALFEDETGIAVEVRYGDSAELAATLAEEGDGSPADVFFAQDAGALGAVAAEGLLAGLPVDLLERVDERYRDAGGRWVGTSGRVRVLAYNTDAVSHDELPGSVLELTDPRWKGKIGLPPTNASFQAFVTAMRLALGEEETRRWLEGIKANEPKLYEKNSPVLEALAAGEIEVGLVNHYYLYLLKEEQPDAPVDNHFLDAGDPGALVNVAGVGVLAGSDQQEAALAFVRFLLSDAGQRFYAEEAEEAEYPLVAGVAPREGLPSLESLQGPDISLAELGAELEATLELLNEVGLTS
ncbi:MAG: iron ABC transporter substrate-binding protein [Thermoleophilia bacterium]|nr:iron ABC transporter substrate-binding protein [Thermoleophilia bacterium]